MEPILVTGAAGGTQGSTGRTVAELLLARGLAVRAFVRADDERAARLRSLGAEVVVGDLREIASVLPAVQGVRRAFFTYPVTAGLLDATAAFAAAARQEGLTQVVEVSQLAAAPDAPTPHMRRHWLAEQVFDRAEIGAVHLRAGVFFENLAVVVAASAGKLPAQGGPEAAAASPAHRPDRPSSGGGESAHAPTAHGVGGSPSGGTELALPLGSPDTELPLIAADDVARVAAGILAAPDQPVDPICRLTGEVLTAGEIAAAFGVKYVDLPPAEWEQRALTIYQDPVTVEHLSKLWEIFRLVGSGHDLYQVTEAIEQFGGHPPQTLREFTGQAAT